jgi:hypothetical protein
MRILYKNFKMSCVSINVPHRPPRTQRFVQLEVIARTLYQAFYVCSRFHYCCFAVPVLRPALAEFRRVDPSSAVACYGGWVGDCDL